jgi:uncharacterized protein with GYD domain
LIFISLGRFRKKPTSEMSAQATKMLDDMRNNSIQLLGFYWTLGRYDTVLIFNAPSEKEFCFIERYLCQSFPKHPSE